MAKQILLNGKVIIATGTYVFALQGHTNWVTSDTQAAILYMPFASTLSNLRVNLLTAPGSGNTRTFTVFQGLTDTGITVTFGATDSGVKSDTINTYALSHDNQFHLKETHTGSPVTSGLEFSIMNESDEDRKTALMGRSGTQLTTGTKYLSLAGFDVESGHASEDDAEMVVPTDGTISDFRIFLQIAPGGATDVRTCTVRKNGADTSLSAGCQAGATSANDSGSVTVSKGDVICVKQTTTNTPAASNVAAYMTFISDTRGEFIIGTSRIAHNRFGTRYESPNAEDRLVKVLIGGSEQLTGAFDIKGISVDLTTAPGSGNSYAYIPFIDGSSVGSSLTISGTSTSGSQTHSTSVSAGSVFATRVVATSSPDATSTTISYIGFIDDPAPVSDVSAIMMGANF